MTFPAVGSVATFASPSDSSSPHSVDLPSGITAGDLLVMVLRVSSSGAPTATVPSGWAQIASRSSTGVSYVWTRTATGGEGSTVSVSVSSNARIAAVTYRITGADPTKVAAGFAETDVNNPPNLSAPWGTTDNLWIATVDSRRATGSISAAPTNYGGLQVASTGGSNDLHVRAGAAHRQATTGTEDPGAFSASGLLNPHSATIAIGPSSGPAPTLEAFDGANWQPFAIETFDGTSWQPLTLEAVE